VPLVTKLPTVKVVDPHDPESFIVINASDFKEGKHKLYEESDEEKAAARNAPPPEPAWDYKKFIPATAARKLKDAAYSTPESFIEATEDALMNLGLGRQTVTLLKQKAAEEIAERIAIRERVEALAALATVKEPKEPKEAKKPAAPKKDKGEKGTGEKGTAAGTGNTGPDDPQ
jgi:hypothetical protein